MEKKYPIELRTKWECPTDGGAPLLTMPNLPKPLHTVCPRNIVGGPTWEKMRKRGYYTANYKSEISGEDGSTPGALHFHEAYDIDYEKGVSTFKRGFAITPLEHVYFIHSGRAITLYKKKNPLYSANKLLEGAEHGFKLIHDWNVAHPDKPPLKAYQTFLKYLRFEELAPRVEELISKYKIEFWGEDKKKMAEWGDWKMVMIVKGREKEYPTPYPNYAAWEEAMHLASEKDTIRQIDSPFKGGAFDEIENLLK